MKQEPSCVILSAPTANSGAFGNGGGAGASVVAEEKFLQNLSNWNSPTNSTGHNCRNLDNSSCRSGGSLSSSAATNPTTGGESSSILLASSGVDDGGGGSTPLLGGVAPASSTTPPVSSSPIGPHAVYVHVNPGETLSVRVGNDIQHIPGPATVRMVSSHNSPPPMALPLHVPPGHIVQQIIDESGVLRHVILSPQTTPLMPTAAPFGAPLTNGTMAPPNAHFMPVQNGHHHDEMSSPIPPPCQTSPTAFYAGAATAAGAPLPSLVPDHICSLHINAAEDTVYGVGGKNLRGSNRFDKRARRDLYSDFRNVNENGVSAAAELTLMNHHHHAQMPAPHHNRTPSNMDDNISATTSGTEDEETSKIAEMLSRVPPPQVCEIAPRQALVTFQPFDCSEASASGGPFPQIDASEFTYEILVYERRLPLTAAENVATVDSPVPPHSNYRCTAETSQQWLTDLKPSTEYFVLLRALLEERGLSGEPSTPVNFKTKPTHPDKPSPPRLSQRSKTWLMFRWSSPGENGSRILNYHLEIEQNNTGANQFKEVYRGQNKQAKISHLQPSTLYRVRLAAANCHGRSEYSDVLLVQTSGAAPPSPEPPRLVQATPYSLTLEWSKREGDEEFKLLMEDPTSGHGFLTAAVTSDICYTIQNLMRHQEYRFKLSASNEDGQGPPSEVVCFRTLPGKPSPPGRPSIKGKVDSTTLKLHWDCPRDTGGGEILAYRLEMAVIDDPSSSNNKIFGQFKEIYNGAEREFLVSNLQPGVNYKFRAACTSLGGQSQFSDVLCASTACVAPSPCQAPRLNGKSAARQTSLHLKWATPEFNGGSDVTEFDLAMETEETQQTPVIVYKGPKTDCIVGGLSPGRSYVFRVRASNKFGAGHWSPVFETQTAAAPPEPPRNLCCSSTSFNCVALRWEAPARLNGAHVAEYRLQQAARKTVCLQVPDILPLSTASAAQTPAPTPNEGTPDVILNVGGGGGPTSHQQRHRHGRAGSASSSSQSSSSTSPPATPAESSSSSRRSTQQETAAGGPCGANNFLELEFGPFVQIYSGQALQYEARGLTPSSDYAFRVQAVNIAGVSKFSSVSVVRTPPGPPDAPHNLCAETLSCDKISVYWDPPNENGSPLIGYSLDIHPAPVDLAIPVQLPAHCAQYVVEGLKPDTIYRFRVQASNDVGAGPQSCAVKAPTYSLPPLPPALELSSASMNALRLKWSDVAATSTTMTTFSSATTTPVTSDAVGVAADFPTTMYTVEMENRTGLSFSRIYDGPAKTCKAQRLAENTTYRFRIRASTATSGVGPWSDVYTFRTTLTPPPAFKDQNVKVTEVTPGQKYQTEWPNVKMKELLTPGEKIHYVVQLCSLKSAASTSSSSDDYKTVYKGSQNSFVLDNLPPQMNYHRVRVAPVRVTPSSDGQNPIETYGPWSTPVVLSTSVSSATNQRLHHDSHDGHNYSNSTTKNDDDDEQQPKSNIWTDRHWAVLIMIVFLAVTIIVAILLQQLVA